MRSKKEMKQVALAFPMGVEHLEEVMFGIRSYAMEHGKWMFVTSPDTHSLTVGDLEGWSGDGAIGLINNLNDLKLVRGFNMPFVNNSGAICDTGVPRVRVDYRSIGVKAAEFLLRKGYQNYAYYGLKNIWYSDEIGKGYEQALGSNAESLSHFYVKSTLAVKRPLAFDSSKLEAWLLALPKPVAIMTPHDPRGVEIIQTCYRLGINVPQDIAVMSANDDIKTCTQAEPKMSSIARNGKVIGYEAAKLLDKLMQGKAAPGNDIVINPLEVVERESTNNLALHNEDFKEVINYIQVNMSESFTIDELCYEFKRTRRWLEYSFKENLHQSPYVFILGQRIKRVQQLLKEEETHKISGIASMSGFSNTHQMNVAFKKNVGCSPREYRASLS